MEAQLTEKKRRGRPKGVLNRPAEYNHGLALQNWMRTNKTYDQYKETMAKVIQALDARNGYVNSLFNVKHIALPIRNTINELAGYDIFTPQA